MFQHTMGSNCARTIIDVSHTLNRHTTETRVAYDNSTLCLYSLTWHAINTVSRLPLLVKLTSTRETRQGDKHRVHKLHQGDILRVVSIDQRCSIQFLTAECFTLIFVIVVAHQGDILRTLSLSKMFYSISNSWMFYADWFGVFCSSRRHPLNVVFVKDVSFNF